MAYSSDYFSATAGLLVYKAAETDCVPASSYAEASDSAWRRIHALDVSGTAADYFARPRPRYRDID